MRKVVDIAINDLIIYFKNPGAVLGFVIIPIIFALVLGLGFGGGGGPTQLRVDVIDSDQSALSTQFLARLREVNNTLVLCPEDNTEDDTCRLEDDPTLTAERSVERLTNNTSQALIEIPAGFEAALEAGEAASIVYRSNENASAPSLILQSVQAVIQEMGGALVAATVAENIASDADLTSDESDLQTFRRAVFERASELWAEKPFTVDFRQTVQSASSSSGGPNGFSQTIPGMASMFVTFTTLSSAIILPQERRNWTLQRLVVLPLARWQIVGGKILMFFLLGIIQYVALFGSGWLVTQVIAGITGNPGTRFNLGNDLLGLAVIMVSLTLCMTALGLAFATIVRTEMQGAAMLNLLGLTLAPLGGAWWPLDIVPPVMQTIGHLSPIAWAMDGFQKLLFRQGTVVDVLPEAGVLVALAAVFFVIGIARFRYE